MGLERGLNHRKFKAEPCGRPMTTKEPQQPGLVCLREERRKQWVRDQGAPHKGGDFHMGTWRTSLGAEQEK